MHVYTVHEPPEGPTDRFDRAESFVFVKDGFNVWAAVFTPLWLLANRMWLVLIAYAATIGGLKFGLDALGMPSQPVGMMTSALHLLIGLEADTLRRWTLDRAGWRMLGSVTGRNIDECERRFFDAWLPEQRIVRPMGLGEAAAAYAGAAVPAAGSWSGRLGLRPKG